MATSNDTRVRVDGFSKIIASAARFEPGAFARRLALDRRRHVDDGAQQLAVQGVDIEGGV